CPARPQASRAQCYRLRRAVQEGRRNGLVPARIDHYRLRPRRLLAARERAGECRDSRGRTADASAVNANQAPAGRRCRMSLDRGGVRLGGESRLARQGLGPDPPHDLELSVEMLDNRGAALDPVAAIDVAQAEIVADHGVMDVAADDAVEAAPPPGFRGERA